MSDDNRYAEQATICEQTGLPLDRYGNWLVPQEKQELVREELQLFNSPYGHLTYAIGNGDDFVCFDFFITDTSTGKWFGIDATVNSETGGFIDGFGRALVKLDPENRSETISTVISEVLTFIDQAHAREVLYWEHHGNRGARKGHWKLVAQKNEAWELYDMETDRSELNDLAAANPEIVKELTSLYHAWAKRCGVMEFDDLRAHRQPKFKAKREAELRNAKSDQ
jgi:hypothetical protein